ncbi:MAG: hypothetical protein IPO43_05105 [Rhodoferax sp.]|nr:hypothetical protein [Rhodoferax sp.]
MQWSRIKSTFESLLAEKLQGRLRVHVTEYTKAPMDIGRGWITLDGTEIVSVQVPSFYDNSIYFEAEAIDFGAAIGFYVGMPFDEIRAAREPIIQGLAFLDRRMGKRHLKAVDVGTLHEFANIIYQTRCKVEGLKPNESTERAS